MPYISTEKISEIREKIKKEFPSKDGWKFSITRRHHSTVNVDIMSAPFDLIPGEERKHQSINSYYIKE